MRDGGMIRRAISASVVMTVCEVDLVLGQGTYVLLGEAWGMASVARLLKQHAPQVALELQEGLGTAATKQHGTDTCMAVLV